MGTMTSQMMIAARLAAIMSLNISIQAREKKYSLCTLAHFSYAKDRNSSHHEGWHL
jgi:hypothetical protein